MDVIEREVSSWLACLTLAIATSACGFDGAIRDDFYRPSMSGGSQRLPLRVALLDNGALTPPSWKSGGGFGEHDVTLVPGFANAVKAEMASLFHEVRTVSSPEQARQDDLLVTVSTAFGWEHSEAYKKAGKNFHGAAMEITLRPPGWTDDLGRYESLPQLKSFCTGMCSAAPALIGLSLLTLTPIMIPWGSLSELDGTIESIEDGMSTMVKDISTRIRGDARVARFVENKGAARAALAAGDQAERAGDRLQALEQYARAWQARPDVETERRLQDKIAKLAGGISTMPPIAEEARRHGARANAYLKAATTEGYTKVIAELQEAVRAAPLWAEAYYNLGMIQESAGQFSDAVRSLKLYLILAPRSSDAQAVQAKIYELEVAVEKSMKQSS